MVQRFSEGDEGIYPDDKGPLVEYEDYAALELKVLASLSHLERANSSMNFGLQALYLAKAMEVLKNDN